MFVSLVVHQFQGTNSTKRRQLQQQRLLLQLLQQQQLPCVHHMLIRTEGLQFEFCSEAKPGRSALVKRMMQKNCSSTQYCHNGAAANTTDAACCQACILSRPPRGCYCKMKIRMKIRVTAEATATATAASMLATAATASGAGVAKRKYLHLMQVFLCDLQS